MTRSFFFASHCARNAAMRSGETAAGSNSRKIDAARNDRDAFGRDAIFARDMIGGPLRIGDHGRAPHHYRIVETLERAFRIVDAVIGGHERHARKPRGQQSAPGGRARAGMDELHIPCTDDVAQGEAHSRPSSAAICSPSAARSIRRPPRPIPARAFRPRRPQAPRNRRPPSAAATSTVVRSAPPASSDGTNCSMAGRAAALSLWCVCVTGFEHGKIETRGRRDNRLFGARREASGHSLAGRLQVRHDGHQGDGAGRMGGAPGASAGVLRLFRPRAILGRFPQGHHLALAR